ncbi:hypothetical protein [Candidatus Methanoprimaticola sp. MG2]|uniref:hypothetical protein n=1 Tax=Candidatus Methanoprimaticola sp. MG2 TaxID=3228838 RepID=UPI0039C7595F
MNSGRLVATASAILAVASLVVAWCNYEGIMAVISFFALVFGIVASKRCSARMNVFIMIAAAASLVCTFLSVTILSPEGFSNEAGEPSTFWFVLIGLVHSVPMMPLTMSMFVIIASVTGASYNWAIVLGLSPFIGMGMEVPGFVLEYVFEGADNWMTDNGYILHHFLMTCLVMILYAWYLSHDLRKKGLIITEHGMEVLE